MASTVSIPVADEGGAADYAVQDLDHLGLVAGMVDERMRNAAQMAPNGETIQLAVLAALNIADELLRCREASTQQNDELALRAGEMERLLDRVLMA